MTWVTANSTALECKVFEKNLSYGKNLVPKYLSYQKEYEFVLGTVEKLSLSAFKRYRSCFLSLFDCRDIYEKNPSPHD